MKRCTPIDSHRMVGWNVDETDLDRFPTCDAILVGTVFVRFDEYALMNFVSDADVLQHFVANIDPDVLDVFTVTELNGRAAFSVDYSGIEYYTDSVRSHAGVIVVNAGAIVQASQINFVGLVAEYFDPGFTKKRFASIRLFA